MKKREIAIQIISALFIFLFVYAATSKMMDIQKFTIELGKSPLLTNFSLAVATIVPALEILLAFLLCSNKTRLIALNASFFLMTLFTSYLVAILQFSFYIPCTCGGVLQSMNWGQHIAFNCVFILLAVLAIIIYPRKIGKLTL